MKKSFTTGCLHVFLFFILTATSTYSATLTSTQSGAWNASATWGGAIPTTADNVIIDGDFTVTVNSADAVCTSLQLGGTATNSGDGSLAFANGALLKVSGAVTLGVGNRKGNISMALGGTLSCEGFILNSHGTWTPGPGTVELTASNTLPNSDITSFNNLTISAGTTTMNSNIDLAGNLEIRSGATLNGGVSSLIILGNWINDGTFTGNSGTVLFEKNGNQSISGSGTNNFNLVKVNMGTLPSNTLEVTATHFNAPDGFLTLSGGTLKLSGTFTLNNTLVLGPAYNIPVTSGLWLNNPNVTVKAQAGGVSLRGILHITAGNMNIGTSTDHNLTYVAGASLTIEGGSLNIAGNLAGNNSTSTLSYNQSGGQVVVATEGSTDPVAGAFDLSVAGSSYIMSGGKLIVRNATSGPADLIIMATARTVTGGMVQAGDALSGSNQTIRIQSQAAMYDLDVAPAVTAQLTLFSLDILHDLTVEGTGKLDANGLNLTVGGNWNNQGQFIAGPSVTFAGLADQTFTSPANIDFNNLNITKSGTAMTFNSDVSVAGSFTLNGIDLTIGEHVLALSGTVSSDKKITGTPASTVKYQQPSDGQKVLAGQYGNLVFSDFRKDFTPDGLFDIAGHWNAGSSTEHTAPGTLIAFTGADQNVPEFSYFNLTIDGTGTKHSTVSVILDGILLVQEGVIFKVDSSLVLKKPENLNHGTILAGQMDVQTGAELKNFHSVTVDSFLKGAGTFTQENNSVLVLTGASDISGFEVSADGNTVSYSGADASIKPATYHHLLLNGPGTANLFQSTAVNGDFTVSGTVTAKANSDIIVGGNLLISAGATFQAGGFTHSLAGDFTVNGNFSPDTGIIRLNGTSEQHIAGTTYAGLFVDNPVPVVLSGDAAVNRTLGIVNGALQTGEFAISLGSDAELSETPGHTVSGEITTTRIVDAVQGTETFGNIGADLVLGGKAPGSTIVTRTTGIASQGINHSSIMRYFDILPTVNTGLGAELVLHYDVSEIEGQNEGAFELYSSEDQGSTWANQGGTANSSGHSVSLTGVDHLSRWTVSDTLHPLDNSNIPTSVGQPGKNKDIILYPQPAKDRLWFSETLKDVEVLNIYGQVVISRMKTAESVPVEGLKQGTYFIRSQGRVMRFVKE